MEPDTCPPPDRPLHLGLLGGSTAARRALAQALAEALSLHCDAQPPPPAGGVTLIDLSQRVQRDALRRLYPGLLLVRLPGAAEPPLEATGADEPVYTALADASVVGQARALLPRLLRAVAVQIPEGDSPMHFDKVVLYTDTDGRARFRDEAVPLTEGKPQARLSPLMPSGGLQLRMSPAGFRSDFHCTEHPQWLFVLRGQMEIGLQDGSTRAFSPGDHFYSADTLPAGATFDPQLHGHRSRQVGEEPLVTAFVRS